MNAFPAQFQKIKADYEACDLKTSGLICTVGSFQGCPFIKLYRPSWRAGDAGIFFSVWTDKDSERPGRLHYNIHALKMRQLKTHVIASRDFANAFRKEFQSVRSSWPHVSTEYGPLNLMQGWIELREKTIQHDVLALLHQFVFISPIIDSLLSERMRPAKNDSLTIMRRNFGSMRGPSNLSTKKAYRRDWTKKRT